MTDDERVYDAPTIASEALREVSEGRKPGLTTLPSVSSPPFSHYFSSGGMYDYAAAVSDWSGPSFLEEAGLARFNCSPSSTSSDCSYLFSNNDTWLQKFGNDSSGLFNETASGNSTSAEENLSEVIVMAVTSVILALIILITIIGNVFVIAAIILERNLQNVANYLVASLAVADLMVACLVMPLGAVYEISKNWILGAELCDMWTSSDVLCCTASILHLVAIATDRYWAVTNVDYIHTRNERRIFTMIVLVWSVALIVSLAPQFGWKDPDYLDRITLQQRCLVSQDVSYQIFATCSTFYVPLLVILILYWKIFQTARKRIHRRRENQRDNAKKDNSKLDPNNPGGNCDKHSAVKKKFLNLKRYGKKSRSARTAETLAASLLLTEGQSTTTVDTVDDLNEAHAKHEHKTTAFTISEKVASSNLNSNQNVIQVEGSTNVSPEKSSTATTTNNGSTSHQSHMSDISRIEMLNKNAVSAGNVVSNERPTPVEQPMVTSARDKKESLEAKRERKAAKTLAIITGAFVVCWLPFFIMALVMPICQDCVINDYMASFFLWLGYFNSTLNPVIYTIFSPDFRQAFARILFGRHRRRRPKKY